MTAPVRKRARHRGFHDTSSASLSSLLYFFSPSVPCCAFITWATAVCGLTKR